MPTGDDLVNGTGARGGVCGPERPESGEVANDVDMVVVKKAGKMSHVTRHTLPFAAVFAQGYRAGNPGPGITSGKMSNCFFPLDLLDSSILWCPAELNLHLQSDVNCSFKP